MLKRIVLLIFIVIITSAAQAFAQTPSSASATGGWRRIAYLDLENGRGFGKVSIWTSGGAYTPYYTDVFWFKDWNFSGGISLSSNSKDGYWSEFRLVVDNGIGYIEANFKIDVSVLKLLSDPYGWNTAKVYSGVLPPSGTGTVLATAKSSRFNVENDLTVAFNGNVGINTPSPNEKLEVNGTIRAKEIKVEAAPWPDYVFEEIYYLKPLSEIEQFIKANKRLPDVPSAKQVAEDGVSLGEMNRLLLQKVEELTLHLIEMEKKHHEQQVQINQLLKKNNIDE